LFVTKIAANTHYQIRGVDIPIARLLVCRIFGLFVPFISVVNMYQYKYLGDLLQILFNKLYISIRLYN